jgi:hypothetical protein
VSTGASIEKSRDPVPVPTSVAIVTATPTKEGFGFGPERHTTLVADTQLLLELRASRTRALADRSARAKFSPSSVREAPPVSAAFDITWETIGASKDNGEHDVPGTPPM